MFSDKRALDPLAESKEIVARDVQERELASILTGIHEGYLPTTVSIYGPPETGKTVTTRRICREFATRHDVVAVKYGTLTEWHCVGAWPPRFSAATTCLVVRRSAVRGPDTVLKISTNRQQPR